MNIPDMLCDMHDIKKMARLLKFGDEPKDNEGTSTTINDCIENVIKQLEDGENAWNKLYNTKERV